MILVDSSIWIDHIRSPDASLSELLGQEEVIMHPYVVGEVALGSIKDRAVLIRRLNGLVGCEVATHAELMRFMERHQLYGRGIGYVDAHLLAATLLTPGTRLWTRDKRLRAAAELLRVAAEV